MLSLIFTEKIIVVDSKEEIRELFMKKCAQLTIRGKVQNIGFRYNAQVVANQYNVAGYIRNMHDGTVFVEAEGEESDLEKFISWCRKGPAWSYVENVDVIYIPLSGYSGFKIR